MNAQLLTRLRFGQTVSGFVWMIAALLSPLMVIAQDAAAITGQVIGENGKPLANITVSISASGANPTRAISRSTTTDEKGEFQFRDLPNRGYTVYASGQKGYVLNQPALNARTPASYHLGDNVSLTLIRGGVITGRVINSNGEPVVNVSVTAIRVRDQEGNKFANAGGGSFRFTDDRGIYRIYGLAPGAYIVSANGSNFFSGMPSLYVGEMPTFHPSSTRDTAAEVTVAGGNEVSGIDIRYRGESGHTVSGKISGGESLTVNASAGITLRNVMTGIVAGTASFLLNQSESSFAIYGISDGEYELTASRSGTTADEFFAAEPLRVTVKGTDVAGIELRMMPTASVTGRVIVEKSPAVCDAKLKPSLEDASVSATHDDRADGQTTGSFRILSRNGSADEKGEFTINGLAPARYRLQVSLPNETWLVKSINGLAPASARLNATRSVFTSDLTRASIPLKSGDKLTDVTIAVTDGGASLRGKILPKEGSKLPARTTIHLVPAEPSAANDVLRYAERSITNTGNNTGAFVFNNIPPGKYWLLARPVIESGQPDRSAPVRWDATERAKLLKEAAAAKNEIELKACQRVKDHVVRF